MKLSTIISLIALIAGCASSTSNWHARTFTDEFTDVAVCRVAQFPNAFSAGYQYQVDRQLGFSGIRYHFVVENRDGGPRVGVIASHNIPIVGDLQFRVDQNEAIIVTPQETPIDSGGYKIARTPGLTDEQFAQIESAISGTAGLASPSRMASGDKALTLLKQIQTGKTLKYRTVGINSATSTVANIDLTEELVNAIRECGIKTQ